MGVELVTVRQTVMQFLSGYQAPGPAEAVTVGSIEHRDGPRCPACRRPLEDHVSYRVLPVAPAGDSEGAEPIEVIFVYCLACGVVIAQSPVGSSPVAVQVERSDGQSRGPDVPIAVDSGAAPPVPRSGHERVVGEGVTAEGLRWTLRAGGSDESYSTMLRTEDDSGSSRRGYGRAEAGGSDRLNAYTGGNPERGPRRVVVRCDPSVVRVVLIDEYGEEIDLIQCGGGVVAGLRFGIALVDPGVRLREVVGFDSEDAVVERFDLGAHEATWHQHP